MTLVIMKNSSQTGENGENTMKKPMRKMRGGMVKKKPVKMMRGGMVKKMRGGMVKRKKK